MSAFDNCLFYRNDPSETTYVLVYVNDTFVFLQTLITSIGKHYEVTLDMDATSFLVGLQHTHDSDNTVTLTQPKLLQKLFTHESPAQALASHTTHMHQNPKIQILRLNQWTPTRTFAS